MTVFIITYDLNRPGQNYPDLMAELKKLEAHRALESFWLINLNNSAKEVVDHFKQFIDNNDAIWVSELVKGYHFVNAKSGTKEWLSNNPPAR
jgi:hypothetical protein